MNQEKQADNSQEKPEAGTAPQTKPQVENQGKTKAPATGKGWRLLTLFLLLVILAGGGVLAWFGQILWLERGSIEQALAQQVSVVEALQQSINQKSVQQGALVSTLERKFAVLQKEQQRQLELVERNSDATHGDTLLDEAEFLIRLANQRLLVERRPGGAQALLETADEVLAKFDDPGLISIRKTLAENLSELRRTSSIDREGLFLRIGALSELMMNFSALPAHGLGVELNQAINDGQVLEDKIVEVEESWYQRLWGNLGNAARSFVDRHFHVRSLEQPMAPLMSIGRETQLRHRLLIDLGNAQQAVLREEAEIYQASLARAEKDISQYFILNDETLDIIEQLVELQSEAVWQELPDISSSLYALRNYRTAIENRPGYGED